jgi:predicted dehydrogenase
MSGFRWGILGTGGAATSFVAGLPKTGSAAVAVASRQADRARAFAGANLIPVAHDTYGDAIRDSSVDGFYLATPPSTHRDLAIECLRAGKPVLVEKPFATNAVDAAAIADEASAAGVVCMEAMWTRFLPAVARARQIVRSGTLGEICLVNGSFGIAEKPGPASHLFDPTLGGGALLDRAVYPVSLIQHLLGTPTGVVSQAHLGRDKVDEYVSITLTYAHGAQAVILASLTSSAPNDLTIMGTHGMLRVHSPIYRPSRLTLTSVTPREAVTNGFAPSRLGKVKNSALVHKAMQLGGAALVSAVGGGTKTMNVPYHGNGYTHEACEFITLVSRGETQSQVMPLADSISVLSLLDAARSQWA